MEYSPRMYIDLEGKQLSDLKDLTVGQTVQILVEGKVCSIEQRMGYEGRKQTGSVALEGYKAEILEDEENEFVNLANDED